MASAPILSACLVYSSTVAISGPWTPMVMAVLPPLPAATMASAPSRRSCFERVVHSLAICGQMTPCTPPRFRNLISAARHSRSSWLESVNGDDPIGKSPRIGFEPGLAAAESRLKASAEANAPPPNPLKKSRLPLASGAVVICLGIGLLTATSDANRQYSSATPGHMLGSTQGGEAAHALAGEDRRAGLHAGLRQRRGGYPFRGP